MLPPPPPNVWVIDTLLKVGEVPFQIPVLDACIDADPLIAVPAILVAVTISVSVMVFVIVWSSEIEAAVLDAEEKDPELLGDAVGC